MDPQDESLRKALQELRDSKRVLCREFDTLTIHRNKLVQKQQSNETLDVVSKSVIYILEKVDELFHKMKESNDHKTD